MAGLHRIWILGCSGSGKSTLTAMLAQQTGLPAVHLDQYFWQPGWQESDIASFQHRVAEATKSDRWVADGGYISALQQTLFPKADLFIQFDLPRWLCLWRIFKRIVSSYGKVRPDMAAGCPERFDPEFVRYVWNYNKVTKPRVDALLATRQTHQKLVIIKSSNDLAMLTGQILKEASHA